jgi:hypothetical protein
MDSSKAATSIKKRVGGSMSAKISKMLRLFGVPYGSRTRVAAVKEKRQRNLAAWIALLWDRMRSKIKRSQLNALRELHPCGIRLKVLG